MKYFNLGVVLVATLYFSCNNESKSFNTDPFIGEWQLSKCSALISDSFDLPNVTLKISKDSILYRAEIWFTGKWDKESSKDTTFEVTKLETNSKAHGYEEINKILRTYKLSADKKSLINTIDTNLTLQYNEDEKVIKDFMYGWYKKKNSSI